MLSSTVQRLGQAMADALKEIASETTVDADNVEGLDRAIESHLDEFEVEADKVKGLADTINDEINDHDFNTDDIEGFDEAVREEVDNCLPGKLRELLKEGPSVLPAVRAVDVKGLDDMTARAVDNYLATEKKEVLVRWIESVLHHPNTLTSLFVKAVREPAVRDVLDQAVRESLLRVVQGFLGGLVPTASPVTNK